MSIWPHSYLQSPSVLAHLQWFGTLELLSDVSSTETLFKTCCFFAVKSPLFCVGCTWMRKQIAM